MSWSVISFRSFVAAALLVAWPGSLGAAVPAAPIAEASAHGGAQPDLPDRLAISVGAQMGVGHSPYPAPEAHTISGLLTAFILAGEARVRPAMAIQLRLPLVMAGVDQPAGGAHGSNAFGHPEAAVVWHPWTSEAAALFARFGLALPIGGGDAALGRRPLESQALSLASALHGWREDALFAPGRLGLTASARGEAGFDLGTARAWRLRTFGEVRVPALIAVDRGTPDPRVDVHAFALSTILGGGAAVSWSRLRLGVAPWLAFHVVPQSEIRGQPASGWALSLVPDLTIRITGHVGLSVGASVPLAGALDGSTALGVQAAGAW